MSLLLPLAGLFLVASPELVEERLNAPGLKEPVEILTDRWGVAHIYAQNEHDLFFAQDNEDLYVYDVNPENPNQYRYLGGWEDMRIIRESIAIKGESPETVELKYTRHGPVLHEDREHHKAYALRAAWMEIGGSPYLASLRMDQAKTWEEFVEA